MNIVNFTPVTATLGGILIGLAVVVFFLFNGRLVGISGIAANALTNKDNRFDNILFLLGLVIGPILYNLFANNDIKITPTLRYSNNALFLIKEDFEQDNDVLKLIFNARVFKFH